MDLIKKDAQHDERTLFDLRSKGVACIIGKCDYCKSTINNRWDRQEIWFLNCGHIYHARCIAKTDGKCSVCFDELEAFCKFHYSATNCHYLYRIDPASEEAEKACHGRAQEERLE